MKTAAFALLVPAFTILFFAQPCSGSGLRVYTEPPGAEVLVNGKSAGRAPLSLKVPPGKTDVEIAGCRASVDLGESEMAEVRFENPGDSWNARKPLTGPMPKRFIEYKSAESSLGLWRKQAAIPDEVRNGLSWLARHQRMDGSWSCDKFHDLCKSRSPCSGPGQTAEYNSGVTGLALMAFLGAGQTLTAGEHGQCILKGMECLLGHQGKNGIYGPTCENELHVYGHLMSTIAVLECAEMDGSPTLRESAVKAIEFIVKARNPKGAWRYGVQPGESDTSVTSWALYALTLARYLGYTVPFACIQYGLLWHCHATYLPSGSVGYVDENCGCSRPGGTEKFSRTEALTAASLFVQLFLGRSPTEPQILLSAQRLPLDPPTLSGKGRHVDLYYWFWGTHGLYFFGGRKGSHRLLARDWKKWWSSVKTCLGRTQCKKKGACNHGSWSPSGVWGESGGRVYATAMSALILEAPSRYPDWPADLPKERTFVSDFLKHVREDRIGYKDLKKFPSGRGRDKYWDLDKGTGRFAFRVLQLAPVLRGADEEGKYKLRVHVLEYPGFRKIEYDEHDLSAGHYQRLKALKFYSLVDLGPFSGFTGKEERKLIAKKGITKSAQSKRYKRKLLPG